MSKNETVTPRQRRAIEALVTFGTTQAACEVAGVSRTTLYRWLRQPAFRQALAEAERAALAELQRDLLVLARGAKDALKDALASEDLRQRLRAADMVLGRLLQLHEMMNLEERLAELEKAVESLTKGEAR
ncbi:phBC6A51 family helix-turn-helix protein [Thermoflexus sp.]|uniref:phBC6A51 family helix-turn-helix protein n=1 Tax=Thermoflexus sp. TaxID=1969742 RepID=UPI0035E43CA6